MLLPIFERLEINAISGEIQKREKPLIEALSIIENMDYSKRLGAGLNVDIVELKLSIVNDLISKKKNERNFIAAKCEFITKIDILREDYLANFDALLGARDQAFCNNILCDLTPDVKQSLREEFTAKLTERLNFYHSSYDITEKVDLRKKQLTLIDFCRLGLEECETLLDMQTMMSEKYMDLNEHTASAIESLKQKLNDLRSDEPKNIYHACFLGNLVMVKLFAQTKHDSKSKINMQYANTLFRPLDYAAYQGDPAIIQFLLEKGANPDLKSQHGYTPVHWAAQRGHIEALKILLNHQTFFTTKIDLLNRLNAKGEYDRTPLHMATFQGCIEAVKFLIAQKGIEIDAQTNSEGHSMTPLHNAIFKGNREITLMLLKDPRVNPLSGKELTPFKSAFVYIFRDDIEIQNAILSHPNFLKACSEDDLKYELSVAAIQADLLRNLEKDSE